jgi:hypothetical protein
LEGFKGYIHCDGYEAYHTVERGSNGDIKIIGCWLHARREFTDAFKALPKDDGSEKPNAYRDSIKEGIRRFNELFGLERKYRELGLDYEERYQRRLEESKPLAQDLFEWADRTHALPQSKLGAAVEYLRNQKQWLMNVYLDGRLDLSNNRAERGVKPLVLGRKNWLFCNTPKGAESSVIMYSIVETAKANGLNPYCYIEYLLDTLPNIRSNEIANLLPWSKDLPISVFAKAKPKIGDSVKAGADVAI